jgi:energy-coupling factor transporter transmembrane protein EcfT
VHPSTRLVVWFLMLVLIQNLEGSLLAAALLVLPLCGGPALRRCWQLTWGARWLFLSLFVILAWGGAGDPAWNGAMAPSLEGLADALTHIGRLLLVLMAVTVLRARMPLADLLSGAHRLLEPLRRCGLDADRGLVRLLLVLRYMETMPRARDWRLLLEVPEQAAGEMFELADRPLGRRDYLAITVVVVSILALFYLRQG